MLGYGCMHENIYIFATLRRKPGILDTRFVFLQYKNTKKQKINTREKQRYYSFFFKRGWVQLGPCGWTEPSQPNQVTCPDQ
jgi:hypothetical protein